MCDQTEITYEDGEIVWVRLGSCWWPGQVTGFENLPDDLQIEFKKKSLIAAVKFFQEETFELVKNISQIFKYNCTKKDEFIRKGLDKYRSKIKDGSTMMNKFPKDVQMAETLTGGDPDIINDKKFVPSQKPNISSLFGEKKIPKKKRDKEDNYRKSMNDNILRRLPPQPRFHKEPSDHEVRIRQQPSSLTSTPESKGSIYRCQLLECTFSSTRLNTLLSHTKSHNSVGWVCSPLSTSLSKSYSEVKSRMSLGGMSDSPKRKYVKKNKSFSGKVNLSRSNDSVKRKHSRSLEKSAKKKKADPEIRDLLADWDDGTDEDMDLDLNKSTENLTTSSSPSMKDNKSNRKNDNDDTDTADDLLKESDKFLNETEKLTMYINESTPTASTNKTNNKFFNADLDSEDQNSSLTGDSSLGNETFNSKKLKTPISKNNSLSDDKKSKLSCFDFNEEEPEPVTPPVRKIHRNFGEKNMSLKKEIIKKFEKSQALQNEKDNEERQLKLSKELMESEKPVENQDIPEEKPNKTIDDEKEDISDDKLEEEIKKTVEETKELVDKIEAEVADDQSKREMSRKSILDILEAEKEHDDEEEDELMDVPKAETEVITPINKQQQDEMTIEEMKDEEKVKEEEKPIEKIEETVGKTLEEKLREIVEPEEEEKDKKPSTPLHINQPEPVELKSDDVEPAKMMELDIGRVTIEEDDDTLPISQLTHSSSGGSGISKLGWSQLNEIIGGASVSTSKDEETVVAEMKESELTPVRRGRGRPRKSQPGVRGNGDSVSEIYSDSPDRKLSETESERSYSGSKRQPKPNKKYLLESEAYSSSTGGRTPGRTDDSQSETEDRPLKIHKKGKRGRKLGYNKSIRKSLEEQESSDQTLDSAEESASYTPTRKLSIKSPDLSTSHIMSPVHLTDMLTSSSSDVEVQSSIVPSDLPVNTIQVESDEKMETPEEVMEEVKVKDSPKKVMEKIDMLPPKKSQIKKFELSQIDLLENTSLVEEKIIETAQDEIKQDLEPAKSEEVASEVMESDESNVLVEETVKTVVEPESVVEETVESVVIKEMVDKPEQEHEHEQEQEQIQIQIQVPVQEQEQDQEQEENQTQLQEQIHDQEEEQEQEQIQVEEQEHQDKQEQVQEPEPQVQIQVQEPDQELALEQEEKTEPKLKLDLELEVEKEEAIPVPEIEDKKPEEIIVEVAKEEKEITEKIEEGKMETEEVSFAENEVIVTEDVTETPEVSIPVPEVQSEVVVTEVPPQSIEIEAETETKSEVEIQSADNLISESMEVIIDDKSTEIVEEIVEQPIVEEEVVETKEEVSDPVPVVQAEVNNEQPPQLEVKNEPAVQVNNQVEKVEEPVESAPKIKNKSSPPTLTAIASTSTAAPSSEVTVPVKKREKPRIIENIQLDEPILKTKLTEKSGRGKRTFDLVNAKKLGLTKSKILKIDPNSKVIKSGKGELNISQKLQILKQSESLSNTSTSTATSTPPPLQVSQPPVSQTITVVSTNSPTTSVSGLASGEKLIQQSSQSLEDLDFDIISMPLILSDDLISENIEQTTVVISSENPTPAGPVVVAPSVSNQVAAPVVSTPPETITVDDSPKKRISPAILKPKTKAKPTITSITKVSPPITKVNLPMNKAMKIQNSPDIKTTNVMNQKINPGKLVVLSQTPSGPKLNYTLQSGVQSKMVLPAGKITGNAQIIHQGDKFYIVTGGQTKMVPLNVTKDSSNKVSRLLVNKGSVYPSTNVSPKGTPIIVPKSNTNSPTTSKFTAGQKIINASGVVTKGLLTPITSAKSTLIGINPAIVKNTVYPSASPVAVKNVVNQKTVVTSKGTITSPVNTQGTSKATLAPFSPGTTGKTIVPNSGLIAGKNTVLKPMTGSHLKAMAAKSPNLTKASKGQCQSKGQVPMLSKCQKLSPVSSPVARITGGVKPAPGMILLQTSVQQSSPPPQQQQQQQQKQQQTQTQSQQTQTHIQQPQMQAQQVQTQQQQNFQPKVQTIGKKIAKSQTNVMNQAARSPQITVQQQIIATTPVASRSKTVASSPKSGGRGRSRQKAGASKSQPETIILSPPNTKKLPAISITPLKNQTAVKTGAQVSPQAKEQSSTKVTSQKFAATSKASNVTETHAVASPSTVKPEVDKVITQAISESKPEIQSPQPQIQLQVSEEDTNSQQSFVNVPNEYSEKIYFVQLENGQYRQVNSDLMAFQEIQNPDHTIFIQSNDFDEQTLNNLVLHLDNGSMSNVQVEVSTAAGIVGAPSTFIAEPINETISTSNHDILAAAVANSALSNSDFQQEIGIPEIVTTSSVMTAGLTQTSLNNQTILQSTIIPTSEPISSAIVSETSLTINQPPIMTPLELPSSLQIQNESSPVISSEVTINSESKNIEISYVTAAPDISTTTVTTAVPISSSSNSNISNNSSSSSSTITSFSESSAPIPGNSMPDIGDMIEPTESVEIAQEDPVNNQFLVITNLEENLKQSEPSSTVSYSVSISENCSGESQVQITPSMPIIDDTFTESVEYSTVETVTSDSSFSDVSLTKTKSESKVDEMKDKIVTETKNDKVNLDMPMVICQDEDEKEKKEEKLEKETPVESIECSQSSITETLVTDSEPSTANMPTDEGTKESSDVTMHGDDKMELSARDNVTEDDKSTSDSKMDIDTCNKMEIEFSNETSQEAPSQSNEEFDLSIDLPSQSKSENSREPSQSATYEEPMEIDENIDSGEPPTQSFKDLKSNEASQSYETVEDNNTNTPTQSFNEVNKSTEKETDGNFPTQSYAIEKVDKPSQNVESESELSQEGNVPSQSNDIGTSSNNVLNEDETASSSYVPETPEAQERDQDQESAISTSSYEISPCEEINIASSTAAPDTSVGVGASEHSSIHDNGVPEIPTSSYNLNPDSSSTHADAPTSSFQDQVVVEQNVSTSYEVPISMPGLEENSSQNFVSESTTEPTSYYPEDVTSEASQSYFVPEGTSQSPSYYEPPPESEASQSFYSQDIEKTSEQSGTEATQSFYQESTDELRLRSEATPTYIERYPVDYPLENSPIERHDLVESSVPATKPAER